MPAPCPFHSGAACCASSVAGKKHAVCREDPEERTGQALVTIRDDGHVPCLDDAASFLEQGQEPCPCLQLSASTSAKASGMM